MKRYLAVVAAIVLLGAGSALAAIGGGEVTLRNKGGDVIFSHEVHVAGAGQKCQECHPTPFTNAKQHKAVNMKAMQKGRSCGACHDGKTTFPVQGNCAKCHKK